MSNWRELHGDEDMLDDEALADIKAELQWLEEQD